MILDTSYFIKLRPLDLVNNNKYITTQYIINEIKDVHARDFYNLNRDFIEISNPSKDSMKAVSSFAKASNDLSYLSVADLSIIALAYETINKIGKGDLILKKPSEYQIVLKDKVKEKIQKEEKKKEEAFKDDGFSKEEEDDEGEWITPERWLIARYYQSHVFEGDYIRKILLETKYLVGNDFIEQMAMNFTSSLDEIRIRKYCLMEAAKKHITMRNEVQSTVTKRLEAIADKYGGATSALKYFTGIS